MALKGLETESKGTVEKKKIYSYTNYKLKKRVDIRAFEMEGTLVIDSKEMAKLKEENEVGFSVPKTEYQTLIKISKLLIMKHSLC